MVFELFEFDLAIYYCENPNSLGCYDEVILILDDQMYEVLA